MKKKITQWQYNKIQVFIKRIVDKYSYLLNEIKKDADEYFGAEGMEWKGK